MKIIIVGSGKLASELLDRMGKHLDVQIVAWTNKDCTNEKSIVVHAGSGRELKDVIAYCHQTNSPLVELATGSEIEVTDLTFPVVVCANTNILMLKFMNMLAKAGHVFSGYSIKITESHQVQKQSVPGTAVKMAEALGLNTSDVRSVRDQRAQKVELRIPEEHLDRHAYHQILIEDAACSVTMETRVFGASPYADGVTSIISAIRLIELENRLYTVNEFVDNGWI